MSKFDWPSSIELDYGVDDYFDEPRTGQLWDGTGVEPGAGRPKRFHPRECPLRKHPGTLLIWEGEFTHAYLDLKWFFARKAPTGTLWLALLRELAPLDNDETQPPELLCWIQLGHCTVSQKSIRISTSELGQGIDPFKFPIRIDFEVQPEFD